MDKLIDKIKSSVKSKHVIMDQFRDYIDSLGDYHIGDQTYRIRFGREDDIPGMVELERQAYQGYLAWSEKDFRNDWRKNPYGVYIVLEDIQTKQVIGMVSGRFLAKGAHISHLIVLPNHGGHGLGQILLQLWINMVEMQRIPKITLEVRKSNLTAQHIYRKHHFLKEKELPYYYYDNDETAYFLCRYSRGK